jgi:putative hemolysin
MSKVKKSISLVNLIPPAKQRFWKTILIRLADTLLGISKMNTMYQQQQMQGLSKEAFSQRLIENLQLDIQGLDKLKDLVPKNGPVVIASNHPFGGIEGVFLSWSLGQVRHDLKVLANEGLRVFEELQDYFIFTNPLNEGDPKNAPSLRESLQQVKQGKALMLFPAGRVSYFRKDKKRISEHEWNRIVAKLIEAGQADYLPVFVAGKNSKLFYWAGRVQEKLRMLLLGHELLNKVGAKIAVNAGNPIAAKHFATDTSLTEQAALMRALSYAQDPDWQYTWPADKVTQYQPLAQAIPSKEILREIATLPKQQHLVDYKGFSVYFGYQQQMPLVVKEIARRREWVFREHNEGSGDPLDTDEFDATYTHLFIVKQDDGEIIGAYRMGQTDKLLAENGGDMSALYLSRMFNFDSNFVNQIQPCLEMGRSFLIPEYQRSHYGLFLLWRGIGAFVCQFPQYRVLYGTVSLSKLYDPRSVALMEHALVDQRQQVSAKQAFNFATHIEIHDFAQQYSLQKHLSNFLHTIEKDGKDIPILTKQYQRLGANFHCLGIDSQFNHTPGLLLSVKLDNTPVKLLKQYLGEGYKNYLDPH